MADRKTILLVEDDDDTRESIAKVLEVEGYDVVCAKDGEHAWELVGNDRSPDLVLLDLMMPRMSGEEFLRARAGDPRLEGVPVIVITAFDLEPEGVSHVLRKPLLLKHLLRVVARTLGRPKRRSN